MDVKENSMKILKEREKPFSFYKRDKEKKVEQKEVLNAEFQKPAFKAKEPPASCTVEIFKIMMEENNKAREESIRKNAQLSYLKAKLPPRMEMYEKLTKQQKDLEGSKSAQEIGSFQPPKAKPVPDFEKLQRTFQNNLDKTKSHKRPTEVKPFEFDGRKARKTNKTKASLHTYVDDENDPKGFNVGTKPRKTGEIPYYGSPANPKTTKKQLALEERRRQEREAKIKKENDLIRENTKRHKQQNRFKSKVQTAYAILDNTKDKNEQKKKRLW